MRVSRRSFLHTVGAGGAGLLAANVVSARGREAWAADPHEPFSLDGPAVIRLSSNENPNGPAPAAIEAMRGAFSGSSRYPGAWEAELREAIAQAHGVTTKQVLLGCGSGELLRVATETFTSPQRHLVSAAPSFEDPVKVAKRIGTAVREVPVDASLGLDLDRMAAESAGAGLVFFCNPNNPTGTVHGADATRQFIRAVHQRSPETVVLVDEAYFEYVDLPSYRTMVPLAIEDPRVVVTRTFSKVYGLAGMRVGYAVAHADTIARLEPRRLVNGTNVLGAVAARVSLSLTGHVAREQAANKAGRAYAVRRFAELGCPCRPTHTNFVMADIRRDVKAFQELCQKRGLAVGRPFPPLTTHLRLSIGTEDEMQRGLDIVAGALRDTAPIGGR